MKRIMLKRLLLLAAMVAMVLAVAIPAVAGGANTGNAQNQIDLIQYASEADDFEFEETGSTLTVSPANTTDCTQAVNQAASAAS